MRAQRNRLLPVSNIKNTDTMQNTDKNTRLVMKNTPPPLAAVVVKKNTNKIDLIKQINRQCSTCRPTPQPRFDFDPHTAYCSYRRGAMGYRYLMHWESFNVSMFILSILLLLWLYSATSRFLHALKYRAAVIAGETAVPRC